MKSSIKFSFFEYKTLNKTKIEYIFSKCSFILIKSERFFINEVDNIIFLYELYSIL